MSEYSSSEEDVLDRTVPGKRKRKPRFKKKKGDQDPSTGTPAGAPFARLNA
jgi:hypothetical protein